MAKKNFHSDWDKRLMEKKKMMKCEKCGAEMTYVETYEKGRHVRELYRCDNCLYVDSKKISTIPINRKVKQGPVKKPYVPWGKSKQSRAHPRKKKRRH